MRLGCPRSGWLVYGTAPDDVSGRTPLFSKVPTVGFVICGLYSSCSSAGSVGTINASPSTSGAVSVSTSTVTVSGVKLVLNQSEMNGVMSTPPVTIPNASAVQPSGCTILLKMLLLDTTISLLP